MGLVGLGCDQQAACYIRDCCKICPAIKTLNLLNLESSLNTRHVYDYDILIRCLSIYSGQALERCGVAAMSMLTRLFFDCHDPYRQPRST